MVASNRFDTINRTASSNTPFADNEALKVQLTRNGDDGAAGTTPDLNAYIGNIRTNGAGNDITADAGNIAANHRDISASVTRPRDNTQGIVEADTALRAHPVTEADLTSATGLRADGIIANTGSGKLVVADGTNIRRIVEVDTSSGTSGQVLSYNSVTDGFSLATPSSGGGTSRTDANIRSLFSGTGRIGLSSTGVISVTDELPNASATADRGKYLRIGQTNNIIWADGPPEINLQTGLSGAYNVIAEKNGRLQRDDLWGNFTGSDTVSPVNSVLTLVDRGTGTGATVEFRPIPAQTGGGGGSTVARPECQFKIMSQVIVHQNLDRIILQRL